MGSVAVIGGGPAGLMAAEVLSATGVAVTVFEAMPTVGRKFLLAGKSGLNLSHSEPHAHLLARYGPSAARLQKALDAFNANDIGEWAAGLGIETFTGTSGRIFPRAMKASPLLRSWIGRLRDQGVDIKTRHRFTGFSPDGVMLDANGVALEFKCDAVVLALGGASWPKLGSDAAWVPLLAAKGVEISALRPSNCGFDVNWSDNFRERFAGAPVKSVSASSAAGSVTGEFVISQTGIEGSLIYAHSASLRDQLERDGEASVFLDLVPGRNVERLARDLARQKPKDSFATKLRKGAGLEGVKAALLRECLPGAALSSADDLARRIKNLPLAVQRPRPIAEAISTAGGITLSAIRETYELKALPGIFAAGEMLDWEAPTGGYLLTACLATGRAAARGVLSHLAKQQAR